VKPLRRAKALIKQALRDIAADLERPGSTERPEILIEGARTYHLWYSRGRVKGQGVKAPRHFLLYRRREEQAWATGSADASRDLPAEQNGGKRPSC